MLALISTCIYFFKLFLTWLGIFCSGKVAIYFSLAACRAANKRIDERRSCDSNIIVTTIAAPLIVSCSTVNKPVYLRQTVLRVNRFLSSCCSASSGEVLATWEGLQSVKDPKSVSRGDRGEASAHVWGSQTPLLLLYFFCEEEEHKIISGWCWIHNFLLAGTDYWHVTVENSLHRSCSVQWRYLMCRDESLNLQIAHSAVDQVQSTFSLEKPKSCFFYLQHRGANIWLITFAIPQHFQISVRQSITFISVFCVSHLHQHKHKQGFQPVMRMKLGGQSLECIIIFFSPNRSCTPSLITLPAQRLYLCHVPHAETISRVGSALQKHPIILWIKKNEMNTSSTGEQLCKLAQVHFTDFSGTDRLDLKVTFRGHFTTPVQLRIGTSVCCQRPSQVCDSKAGESMIR